MLRDTDTIPYRKSAAYARTLVAAAIQRAAVHHRTGELTEPGGRLTTSAVMRRKWFGGAPRRR